MIASTVKENFMRHLRSMLLILCVAVAAAGCAKKDMIVKETAPVQGVAETSPEPVAAVLPADEVRTEAVPQPETAGGELNGGDGTAALALPLETVYFDFDSWLLGVQARESLARTAAWLRSNPGVAVTLEGHTDERGSDAYNLALGEQRAKAAMQYLLNLGISASRLMVVSYGEEKPAIDGDDESAWSRNRRVEFTSRR
jgi:peptidoglycan-associated lipoprotein